MEKRFEIFCPSCLEWSEYSIHSEKEVIEDSATLKDKLNHLGDFPSKGTFQCKSPSWICPSRFEALLFNGDITELYNLSLEEEVFEKPKLFRVYQNRNNNLTRLKDENGKYIFGILFCRENVRRERHILPDYLFDEQLLRKTLRGISGQIGKPVTLFVARVFQLGEKEKDRLHYISLGNMHNDDFVCWIPVEAYNEKSDFIPHNFHKACEAIRYFENDFLKWKLSAKLERWKKECFVLRQGLCGGIHPPCKKQPEKWECCPRYLNERYKLCLCYKSDFDKVKQIYELWLQEKLENTVQQGECLIYDFSEYFFPVIVHNHLIAVAFTGQFINPCINIEKGIKQVEGIIKNEKSYIEKVKQEEIGKIKNIRNEDDLAKEMRINGVHNVYQDKMKRLDEIYEDFVERLSTVNNGDCRSDVDAERSRAVFQSNIESVIKLATTRYIHLRARREELFSRELAQAIRKKSKDKISYPQVIMDSLKTMLDFWAFEQAFFVQMPIGHHGNVKYMYNTYEDLHPSIIHEAEMAVRYDQDELWLRYPEHIICDLYEDSIHSEATAKHNHPFRKVLSMFYKILEEKHNINMKTPGGQLIVSIPYHEHKLLNLFIFSSRNIKEVSPLRPYSNGGISSLCGEMVFETCVLIMHELAIQYPILLGIKKNHIHISETMINSDSLKKTPPKLLSYLANKIHHWVKK